MTTSVLLIVILYGEMTDQANSCNVITIET